MSSSYYREIGFNVTVYETSHEESNSKDRKDNLKQRYDRYLEISKLEGIEKFSIKRTNTIKVNTQNYLNDVGKILKNDTESKEDILTVMSLGKEEYARFVKKIGGKYDEYKDGAILIDDCIVYDNEGKKTQGSLYTWGKGDTLTGTDEDGKERSIKIVAKTAERPMGLEDIYSSQGYLIVSDEYIEQMGYTYLNGIDIQAKDSYKVEDEIIQLYNSKNINEDNYIIVNMEEAVKANNAIVLVISIFLYGFITVITLIGITNIFNTITTNMNLRKKEFAMLKSVGMTKKEFNRMIRLESIFYGLKSLIIGIPIGTLLSYAIYKGFETNMGMHYVLPVKAILISIVFVAVVITIIMKYSMSKINKQNIIETIRNDNI